MERPTPDRGVYPRDELDRDTEGHGFPPARGTTGGSVEDDADTQPSRGGTDAEGDDDVEGHISISR
jgi:hypothetical protein